MMPMLILMTDFPQPGFESAEPLPSVELKYPSGATET
jgi:hypothetical protein